jgi:hypothetical protein
VNEDSQAPLEVLRDARGYFRDWLEKTKRSFDPSAQDHKGLSEIAKRVQAVAEAVREAPSSLRSSDVWKKETADYALALREVKARLANFEITLRIRSAQMNRKQAKLDVIRSWADLARQIG